MTNFDKRQIGATNLTIDELGMGCASLGNLYHPVSDEEASDILTTALAKGFSYFDTAPHYGQGLSERRVGDALRKRKDYVLSTKVGRLLRPAGFAAQRHGFVSPMPFDIEYDYSYDGVLRSFEDSLQRLGLDRIDILYMHDIGPVTHGCNDERLFPIAMDGGYRAMDELRRSGRVSAIGLGVNEFEVCERAMEYGDWDCFLLAGRYTMLEQLPLDTFFPKCIGRGASVIIGGPYNSGILATGVQEKRAANYDYGPAPENIVNKVASIEALCQEFNIPMAAAALQFPLAHPAVASVIPGIGKASRVNQTLKLFRTEIPDEFWKMLKDRGLIHDDAPIPDGNTGN